MYEEMRAEISLQKYERDSESLNGLSLKDKFCVVSVLLSNIRKSIPELEADPSYIVNTDHYPDSMVANQVKLLEIVAGSIQHTPTYNHFVDESRKVMLSLIYNDQDLMFALRNSIDFRIKEDKEHRLQQLHGYHVQASQSVIDRLLPEEKIKFQTTKIDFFDAPIQRSCNTGTISINRGRFSGTLNNDYMSLEPSRVIKLNVNGHAQLNNLFDAASVLFHETTHDQGFQLGAMLNDSPKSIGPLAKDGKIWCLSETEKAVIPCGLNGAYRAQCVEKIAFDQQDIFEKRLYSKVFGAYINKPRVALG